jgi:hypothetical protein
MCTIAVAPTITTRPTSLTTPAQSPVTFHCQATGLPSPHIYWLINNVSLSGRHQKLHIVQKYKGLTFVSVVGFLPNKILHSIQSFEG